MQVDDVVDLRTRVLRAHMPGVEARSPTDRDPATWHLGAYRGGRLVGVVTGFPEEAPGRPGRPAQRFRFMAVDPEAQGGGVGKALMREVIDRARGRGDELLWAHGRDGALWFYTGLGFRVEGDRFLESDLPHHVVVLDL